MSLAIVEQPSPNHGPRPPGAPIDILLLHYTGMPSTEEALRRLADPAAEVSAHYLIDEGGRCYRLVPEARRAWHAGDSFWHGARDVNGRSIGIELANPGHEFGYRDFTGAQMATLEALARAILARHPIPPHRVLGHSDVAPQRKRDPGERFDWKRLARAGIGLWPKERVEVSTHAPELSPGAAGPAVINLQLALSGFGYGLEGTGLYDPTTEAAVAAFQRHFRQRRVDGVADPETQSLLHHLLARIPPPA
ncbi:MAG TPA: N-acetylmuramoyl-L-alanine amidase [Alphaproteobacteria bacterium]|nr:N-acetylmuramoyl-L-alanine amidase [Alphaproteobacteria bacterium]